MSTEDETSPPPAPPARREPESAAGAPSERPLLGTDTEVSADGGAADLTRLSKEEQMALFEKALKEDDWGHQPC